MMSRSNRNPNGAINRKTKRSTSALSDDEDVNPLIDDLLGSIVSQQNSTFDPSCLVGQSISNRNSLVDNEWNSSDTRSNSRAAKSSKVAVETLSRISQHFVHTMKMFNMEDYFAAPNKDEVVRQSLRQKSPTEIEGLVISLLDLLEDARNSRGQIAPLTGSLSALDAITRERLMSASMFSTMSTASMMRPQVQETTRVAMAVDKKGNRMINRYTIVAHLGQGAFGKVKLGEEADTGNQVAIKIIDKKLLKKKIGGPDNDEALKREIAIMKKVRHKNCVSLYEVIDDPDSNKLYLIMDYVPNGPIVKLKQKQLLPTFLTSVEKGAKIEDEIYNKYLVRSIVRRDPRRADTPFNDMELNSKPYIFVCTPVHEHLCAVYLRQLVSGLRYMHKRSLVHHDIKPDNILLGNDHHVYLTDFGVSEMLGKTPDRVAGASGGDKGGKAEAPRLGGGTLVFTAPELFSDQGLSPDLNPYLTDVWALGVTVYCMLLGCLPFFGTSYPQIAECVKNNPFPWNGETLFCTKVLPQWKTILDGMLEKDPKKRWHLTQLKAFLDDPLFQAELKKTDTQFMDNGQSLSSLLSDLADTKQDNTIEEELRAMEEEVANSDPIKISLPQHRTISARARSAAKVRQSISIRAREAELNKIEEDHLNDLKVSDSDIKQATTTAKIEIVENVASVSTNTKRILARYVLHLRKLVEERQGAYYRTTARTSDQSNSSGEDANFTPRLNENPLGGTPIQKILTYDAKQLDDILSIVNLQCSGTSMSFSSSMQDSSYSHSVRPTSSSKGNKSNSMSPTLSSTKDSHRLGPEGSHGPDLVANRSSPTPSPPSRKKVEDEASSSKTDAPRRCSSVPNFSGLPEGGATPTTTVSSTNTLPPKATQASRVGDNIITSDGSLSGSDVSPPPMLRTRVHESEESSVKNRDEVTSMRSPTESLKSPPSTTNTKMKESRGSKKMPQQRLLHTAKKANSAVLSSEEGVVKKGKKKKK